MNHVWEDQMRKTLSLMTGIAAAAVMSSATAAYADCGEVSLTEMNWPSSLIITHVSKFLMEQRPVMH
jgi:glycine betaine/proline transport system substrate-binding protein